MTIKQILGIAILSATLFVPAYAQIGHTTAQQHPLAAKSQAVRKPFAQSPIVQAQNATSTSQIATSTDTQQLQMAREQNQAAYSQAKAAWLQARVALVQAVITGLLFGLTVRQLSEGKRNLDELIKGRKLSQIPVLSLDVEHIAHNPVDGAGRHWTLTVHLKNIGDAPALTLNPRIASIEQNTFRFKHNAISFQFPTVAPLREETQPGITVPLPVGFGPKHQINYYYVSVDYLNVYKQRFTTEAVYQIEHTPSGEHHWSRVAEQFFVRDWDKDYEERGGEQWARKQATQASIA